MRILIIVPLFLLIVLPVIFAQFDIINEDFGEFNFHANVGKLPLKYKRLTEQDQQASEKAADVVDFIHLVPKIDPLQISVLEPIGIDVPFLWFRGKVYFKNLVLAGVKQLEVNSVELRLNNLRLDLNISIPQMYFEGEFNLQMSMGFGFLPLAFKCFISANVMDVDVMISAGLKTKQAPPIGEVLQITSAAIKLDLGNIQLNMTDSDISGDLEEVGEPLTQMFSGKSSDNVFDGVLKTALDIANAELLHVPSEIFKNYLLTTSY